MKTDEKPPKRSTSIKSKNQLKDLLKALLELHNKSPLAFRKLGNYTSEITPAILTDQLPSLHNYVYNKSKKYYLVCWHLVPQFLVFDADGLQEY